MKNSEQKCSNFDWLCKILNKNVVISLKRGIPLVGAFGNIVVFKFVNKWFVEKNWLQSIWIFGIYKKGTFHGEHKMGILTKY